MIKPFKSILTGKSPHPSECSSDSGSVAPSGFMGGHGIISLYIG